MELVIAVLVKCIKATLFTAIKRDQSVPFQFEGFWLRPTIGTDSQRSGGHRGQTVSFSSCAALRKQEISPGSFLFPSNGRRILNEFNSFKWCSFENLTVVYFPQRSPEAVAAFTVTFINPNLSLFSAMCGL